MNMWKKLVLSVIVLCTCIVTSGCTQVIDLTEDETRLVAEYAADLLLSYDRGYTDRLKEGEEEHLEEASTQEDAQSETTTEVVTEEEEATQGNESQTTEVTTVQGASQDIAEIAGVQGTSITYKNYEIVDQYPTGDNVNEAVQVDAPEGSRLLVVHFVVKAVSDQPVDVSLMDQSIDYKLLCNDTLAAKPMLTILTNDLATLETTATPGQDSDAVLIFQISKDMVDQLNTMQLHVTFNSEENVITIL